VVNRKQELFQNVARLRRLGRKLPGDPDVAAVRLALESELGETVSRRLAARVLGVSHTALDRWIDGGDLPVVYSANGRAEVPVAGLLDMYEKVQADRDAAGNSRYSLTPTMRRQREAARELRLGDRDGGDIGGHHRASARSRAYHRAVAARLRRPMVDEAGYVLYRWREQGRIDPRYADRWERILGLPLPEIRQALTEESEAADDLRQSSPFAGVLSEPERRRILSEVG
jgi:hypothetical protein